MTVLFPGDLHELGMFLLKVADIKDREANARNPRTIRRSRPTLQGLSGRYAQVTEVSRERIEKLLVQAGFDLGALVEFDPADSEDEKGLSTGST